MQKAGQCDVVVRLKGGDPFVFGRGGEEAEFLAEEGIEFEVVPGITSAISVPAYAGIPVTHRDFCSTLGIITGHEDPTKTDSSIKWDKIATGIDTLVFLMGVENLPNIVSRLIENGRDAATPVALIRWGTRTQQETLTGTLADIVEKVTSACFKSPAVTVVGEVVKLREKLRWFDNRPLFGRKILVTRSREQAGALSDMLRRHGAEPIEFPVVKIVEPASFDEMDAALDRIESFDWLLFTSANGVRAVIDRLRALGRDIRWLKGPKIGAIGPKTAEAVKCCGINVAFTPAEFVAEAVAHEFPEDPAGKRILVFRAQEAREVLPEMLAQRGAQVDVVPVYRTLTEESDVERIRELLNGGEIDAVTFTSSSTVRNFVELIGDKGRVAIPNGTKIACIGPITAQTAAQCGLDPDVIAEEYTYRRLGRCTGDCLSRRLLEKHIVPTCAIAPLTFDLILGTLEAITSTISCIWSCS